MSDSKIQIKIGIVEFSGEGDPEWLASQLDKILDKIPELLKIELAAPAPLNGKANANQNPPATLVSLSMINVAAKLNCTSGQDLAEAAGAYLKFVLGKPTFSRDDILKHMKEATGYYKSSYSNNLTSILLALVRNSTFTQTADNVYAFHITKEKELNALLAQ